MNIVIKSIITLFLAVNTFAYDGNITQKRLQAYSNLLHELKDKSEERKLNKVNFYFNQMVSQYDAYVWKKEDYWATPKEFIVAGRGDCEDYAIAKYFTLKKLGLDASRLFLLVVKTEKADQNHMVLGYYKNYKTPPLILDNLSWRVLPLDKRVDLQMLMGFNERYIIEKKIRKIRKSDLQKYPEIYFWSKFLKRYRGKRKG